MSEPPVCVNVFLQGNRLRILRRGAGGELLESYAKPEYALFVRKKDAAFLRPFENRRTIRDEGEFVRMICASYEERQKLVEGYRDENRIFHAGYFKEKNVETFEADVSPVKRWLIDSRARVQKAIAGYCDLEIDSRVPFERKGEARMLCWGLVVPKPDGSVEEIGGVLEEWSDAAEKKLILDLFWELAAVDQILCWNGDRFDFEYLKERVQRLGIQVDLRRWLLCDHMQLFAKLNTGSESGDEKASMALDRVAAAQKVAGKLRECGAGELAGVKVGGAKSYEFWAAGGRNRELLLEYCVEDAMTMLRIELKSGWVDVLSKISETCGVLADSRGFRGVNYVESFLMRLGAERGVRAPTKIYEDTTWEEHEQFRGAYVFPTKTGLFSSVHICDFSRLYPSMIQAWNMSPETWRGPALRPDGTPAATLEEALRDLKEDEAVAPTTFQKFRITGERGLLALAVDRMVEQRKYWSKKKKAAEPGSAEWIHCNRMDQGWKALVNTLYGVIGSIFSRFFKKEIAESVTQNGVWLIKMVVAQAAERHGLTAIAGDTDSGFLSKPGFTMEEFREFIVWCNAELFPSSIAPTRGRCEFISLSYEKEFALMISCVKKTYAGRLAHMEMKPVSQDKAPTIKGLEYKRGDSAKIARDMQEEIVRTILMIGKPLPEEYSIEPKDLEAIIERWQQYVLGGAFPFEEAVISQAMKKNPESYGGKKPDGSVLPVPGHVRVAMVLKQRGFPIYPGVKIEYVVADGSKTPQKLVAAVDATVEDVDWFHLWEKEVWPATERVVSVVFPKHQWKRWGAVRPKSTGPRKVLEGQKGFGFGERTPLPKKRDRKTILI